MIRTAYILLLTGAVFLRVANACSTLEIDEAYASKDTVGLTAFVDNSQSVTDPLARHLAGLAAYRLGQLALLDDDKRSAKRHAKRGLKIMDEVSDPSPDDLALISSLYSIRIRTSTMSAIFLGKKSEKFVDRALQAEPENPRALLTKATATFFKPGTFGGGLEKAQPILDRALAAYTAQPADAPVCWGSADVAALALRAAHAQEDEALLASRLEQMGALGSDHPELQALRKDEVLP